MVSGTSEPTILTTGMLVLTISGISSLSQRYSVTSLEDDQAIDVATETPKILIRQNEHESSVLSCCTPPVSN